MRRRWALILLGVSVIAVAVFLAFPRLDIAVRKMMLRGDGHFLLYYERNTYLLHLALQYVVPVVIVFFVIAGIAWRLAAGPSGASPPGRPFCHFGLSPSVPGCWSM